MAARLWRRFGSFATALAFAAAAVLWIASGELMGETEPETQKAPAHLAGLDQVPEVRVMTQSAQAHTNRITVQGRTQADRKVTVRAETHGRIEELLVDKGDRVERGEVLAQLAEEDRPARLQQARALLEQRRIELEAARRLNEKGYRAETQLAGARAAYREAQAAVEQARVALDNTTIFAPFDGIVGATMVEVGDFMSAGSELLRLIDLDPIKVVADINERTVGHVDRGASATAQPVTGGAVDGQISYIASEADGATRTFRIEMEAANPDAAVRDGVTARITLPLRQRRAHFVSPSILTLNDAGEVGVKLLDDRNRVRFHAVQLLDDAPDGVWLGGLPDTVTFVTVGQNFVAEGQEVKPVTEAEVAERLQGAPLDMPGALPGKPGPDAEPAQ
jgi:multidrug efflux system membrane fusion protein